MGHTIEKRCAMDDCRSNAVSLSDFCWEHTQDKDAYRERIRRAVREKSVGRFNLHKSVLKNIELSKADFAGADLVQTNLSDANLFDTDFTNADLVGANLSGSDLTGADLSGADLTKADLSGARLWYADLSSANLVEASMAGADLWQAKLAKARLWRTDITKAKSLTRANFRCEGKPFGPRYRLHEAGFVAAEEAYRSLKRYFLGEARYNDASWASFKEKTMERKRLKKVRDPAYIPAFLMGFLCGYGEKPQRIILSSFLIILIYALIYYFLRSVAPTVPGQGALGFPDHLYYSVVTFTTLGYGDIVPKSAIFYRLLAASEAFIGAFLMGLFIFTLARKYSAR